jgi:hypothetical protein
MSRANWLAVAEPVSAGETSGLRCPERDDDFLDVDWLPGPSTGTGEYRVRCPTCGAENFVLRARLIQVPRSNALAAVASCADPLGLEEIGD